MGAGCDQFFTECGSVQFGFLLISYFRVLVRFVLAGFGFFPSLVYFAFWMRVLLSHLTLKLLIPVIVHILPACSTGTSHVDPCRSPQTNLLSVTRCCVPFGTRGFRTAASTIWNSLPANVRCVTLNIPSTSKFTPFQSSFPTLWRPI